LILKEFPLANIKSAKKRAKQAEVRRQRNVHNRSTVRTLIKRVETHIESQDAKAAAEALVAAIPVIDKMAAKGIMHKNKAARHKSRLNIRVKALG
jgi:small subunit ribosomal protein S20